MLLLFFFFIIVISNVMNVTSCSRDPSPDARQHLKEWMNQKRSERKAEWRGRQEELRAQEYQPFLSPTQVPINDLLLCWEHGERKQLGILQEVTFPGYIFLLIFYYHTANMQCLSILVTGPKGPRSFCFVVSYETFYPNIHILSQGYKWVPTNC